MKMAAMFVPGNTKTSQKLNEKIYKGGCHLPVLPASDLLKANRHQYLIELVQQICGLSLDHASLLYLKMIRQFAEFVQILPIQSNGALTGLLNTGIARATLALQKFILQQEKNIDPLLNYAIYSAALLMDVSKVLINQRIMIVDAEGHIMDVWRPFAGTLTQMGAQFYKIYPVLQSYQRLQDSLTPLLARQLMPSEGFLWIASDPVIFADWLDALRGDTRRGGRLSHFMSLIKLEDINNLLATLVSAPIDILTSTANKYGEAFYQWLKNALEKGEIKINTVDATVHVVDEGVFLEKQLFKQFCDLFNVPVSMNVVFVQFGNLMGIIKKGSSDFLNDQYFSKYSGIEVGAHKFSVVSGGQRSLREGMIVRDTALIFSKVPSASSMLQATRIQTRTPPINAQSYIDHLENK